MPSYFSTQSIWLAVHRIFSHYGIRTGEHLALKVLVQLKGQVARFNREYEARHFASHVLAWDTADGRLLTGEWQQIVLIDFDTRPRRRAGPRTTSTVGDVMTTIATGGGR